jgi:hypothetical protein
MSTEVCCSECEGSFEQSSSKMVKLCPECAHYIYGYKNCVHEFSNNRCLKCKWDGSTSKFFESLKAQKS